MPAEDLQRLREINECSSSGLGSSSGSRPEERPAAAAPAPSALHEALSSGFETYSSQNSMGSIHAPGAGNAKPYLQQSRHIRRRVSDGGPYAATYKLLLERRGGALLAQINSSNSVHDGSSLECLGVKQLLQGGVGGGGAAGNGQYGLLPANSTHKQMLQLRAQVSRGRGRRGRRSRGWACAAWWIMCA